MPDDQKPVTPHQEFRKANEIISPRVKRGGTLTLLSRKVLNVLLYHTQRLGQPGQDAPEGDPIYGEFFWLPLQELAADAAYNSEDAVVLREALQRLQDIKIEADDKNKGFSSDVLMPSIRIVPTRRGKPTMVGWKLDAATERILRLPEFYTRLSIYYLTSLRSTASIALYENAKRYSTNPSGLTTREPWPWWHDVLTGLPMSNEKPEYKYFKRDVLRPAIDEVNTTDITIELIEHKNGRRVEALQFRVSRTAQAGLELPLPPVINTTIVSRIADLGIGSREAEDLYATHDEGFVLRTLDWVDVRLASKELPEVESPAAMFRAALRKRFADSTKKRVPLKSVSAAHPLPQLPAIPDPDQLAKQTDALAAFDVLSSDAQDARWNDFITANPGADKAYTGKKRVGALARKALAVWLAKDT
jgi:hypothetical protein